MQFHSYWVFVCLLFWSTRVILQPYWRFLAVLVTHVWSPIRAWYKICGLLCYPNVYNVFSLRSPLPSFVVLAIFRTRLWAGRKSGADISRGLDSILLECRCFGQLRVRCDIYFGVFEVAGRMVIGPFPLISVGQLSIRSDFFMLSFKFHVLIFVC